jgi:hypothetical protein
VSKRRVWGPRSAESTLLFDAHSGDKKRNRKRNFVFFGQKSEIFGPPWGTLKNGVYPHLGGPNPEKRGRKKVKIPTVAYAKTSPNRKMDPNSSVKFVLGAIGTDLDPEDIFDPPSRKSVSVTLDPLCNGGQSTFDPP